VGTVTCKTLISLDIVVPRFGNDLYPRRHGGYRWNSCVVSIIDDLDVCSFGTAAWVVRSIPLQEPRRDVVKSRFAVAGYPKLPLGAGLTGGIDAGKQRSHLNQCLGEGNWIEPRAYLRPAAVRDVEFPALFIADRSPNRSERRSATRRLRVARGARWRCRPVWLRNCVRTGCDKLKSF
jgi:hypothetical protein